MTVFVMTGFDDVLLSEWHHASNSFPYTTDPNPPPTAAIIYNVRNKINSAKKIKQEEQPAML
jgi:hypothetical protein